MRRGVKYPFQGTVAAANGDDVWVFRYSTESESRSMFFSRDARTPKELYPQRKILQAISDDARLIVSEPVGDLRGLDAGAGVELGSRFQSPRIGPPAALDRSRRRAIRPLS